ncbi:hypothetical protein B6V72_03005 [Thioclava sp. F34-6]|uniref:ATP-binding protein n=1 Tax=Thioclava sp. F34-6 TaxID=1973003 RepID=UPI000B539BA5|nr:AAA family ATPase [Thioclava sp. F34-6]OWY15564.1 hypothetical protein B6V72_03005 [Thioclava sp. F34-6]
MNIALVGISGVGKTTLLKGAANVRPFLHLEASKLIKEEIALSKQKFEIADNLRSAEVVGNQSALLKAFHRRTDREAGLVVLDGHTVLDTGSQLQRIPPSIFAEMNLHSLLFLQDDPEAIRHRRSADIARVRPKRSTDEIRHLQEVAILTAADIALKLAIPLHVVTHEDALRILVTL